MNSEVHMGMGKNGKYMSTLIEQVVERTPAITGVYSMITGEYLFISSGVHVILGYTNEQFLKKGVQYTFTLMHPDDIPRVQKAYRTSLRVANKKKTVPLGMPFVTFEYRIKHKDGSWRWLQTSIAIFSRDKRGKVENIVSTSVEVTAWKEERLKIEEKLRQSEELYRVVVENSRDVIISMNMQGRVTYASPANEKIFGYPPAETFGSYAFDWVHPDDRPRMMKSFSEITKSIGRIVAYRAKHKNGHYIPVEGTGTLVYDRNKKPSMIVGTIRDITQRVQLEKQKDAFIAIASHELKTPVTSLKAYAQVLQKDFAKAGNERAALYLAKMNSQLDRLTGLINDLLDVSKVEEGKLQFKTEQFDFNELVLEIIEVMQRVTQQHIISKKLAKSHVVLGDRDRVGQVITNLLSNAIKYSPDANTIIVSTRVGKGQITTSVQDFGVGISAESQKRVFERFYRDTDTQQESYPGLGLGLFIASEIVKRHKGRIAVRSKKGKGATFSFSLPYINR